MSESPFTAGTVRSERRTLGIGGRAYNADSVR